MELFGQEIQLAVAASYASVFLMMIISYSAMNKRYQKDKQKSPKEVKTFGYVNVWIQYSSAVLGLLCMFSDSKYLLELHHNSLILLAGLAVSLIGVSIFMLAKSALGENYSPCNDQYIPKKWVKSGVYRYIKHPIYWGTSLILIGLAIGTGSAIIIANCIVLRAYQIISAKREEKVLAETFAAQKSEFLLVKEA